jgi:hypothetical protein
MIGPRRIKRRRGKKKKKEKQDRREREGPNRGHSVMNKTTNNAPDGTRMALLPWRLVFFFFLFPCLCVCVFVKTEKRVVEGIKEKPKKG